MKIKLTLIIVSTFFSCITFAQKNYSLRTSVGTTSLISPVGGYFFSFDIGIPIVKGFEITPTLTSGSSLPNTRFENSWTKHNDSTSTISIRIPIDGPRQEIEKGSSFNAFSLLLNFRPFDLSDKENKKRHELLMGIGLSYTSYAFVRTEYEINGNSQDMISLTASSKRGIDLYIFKMYYAYLLKENVAIGGTLSFFGLDGEAVGLLGLQFGVKF
jgi:hypothetical protein